MTPAFQVAFSHLESRCHLDAAPTVGLHAC